MTIFTKGGKTNTIIIPINLWKPLLSFKGNSHSDAPVFKSRNNKALCPSQVWRIVKKAAERVGIEKNVSCHWFRHAHCSHALNRGAKIALVQATLSHSSLTTTGKYIHVNPEESSSLYIDV